jgi:hypothetical protein
VSTWTREQVGDLAYMLENSDAWIAVLEEIAERRQKLTQNILGGGLEPQKYAAMCGELRALDYVCQLPAQLQRSAKNAAETPDNP